MGVLNGWFNRLLGSSAVSATAPAEPRFTESAPLAPAGKTLADEDAGWTRLGGSGGKRDLTPMDQTRMQDLAAHVWESNRLANRLIELPVAFLLGEGVKVEVDDAEAQDWLDAFWHDPINRMDLQMEKHVRELALFGEQCWPTFVAVTGHVRLGKVDPSRITGVVTDPDNAGVAIGVVVSKAGGGSETYRVIFDGSEAIFGEAAQKLRVGMTAGDCFFWRINDLSTGRRGRSDLLSAIDIVDAHEQLIFGEVERATALRQIVWDVELTDASPEEVAERAKTITPPAPLSVRVHNQNEKWTILTPDMKSADASETLKQARNYALGGATIPSFWMADGGDVNLATASSMGEPTYKVFSQRQRLWKAILTDMARYAIRMRLAAIGLPALADDDRYKPRAIFPELTARDLTKIAAALQQIVVSATQAVQSNVMSREAAVRLVVMTAEMLGLQIDADAEIATTLAEAKLKSEADVWRDIPPTPASGPAPAPRAGLEPGEDVQPRQPE